MKIVLDFGVISIKMYVVKVFWCIGSTCIRYCYWHSFRQQVLWKPVFISHTPRRLSVICSRIAYGKHRRLICCANSSSLLCSRFILVSGQSLKLTDEWVSGIPPVHLYIISLIWRGALFSSCEMQHRCITVYSKQCLGAVSNLNRLLVSDRKECYACYCKIAEGCPLTLLPKCVLCCQWKIAAIIKEKHILLWLIDIAA